MKIDEAATAKQPVELLAACRVPRAQPLERGGLIRAEVVHVRTGMVLHARHDKVDEASQAAFSSAASNAQCCSKRATPSTVACQKAGQVFQTVLADERIALEIEEHVAARRLRQAAEPSAAFGQQGGQPAESAATRLHLKARLMTEATISLSASPGRLGGQPAVSLSDCDDGHKTLPLKLPNLRSPDIGDQRGVVVATAAFIAVPPVIADVAMRNRVRIGRGWRRRRRGIDQPSADEPVIRGEIGEPITFLTAAA